LPEPPTSEQLRMLWIASALPFVGFGFLDNFLMILSGDLIDATLCVRFSLSTMAAAAIGNTISDAAGIFSGGVVEGVARKFGVEEPPLSNEQRKLPSTKYSQYSGQLVGILVGCILGCCPLLWIDPYEGERLKHEKERYEVLQTVINKVGDMLQAEAAFLMMKDESRDDLASASQTPNLPKNFRWSLSDGFIGHVTSTGQFVNIIDAQEETLYRPHLHDNLLGSGIRVNSLLCMPIFTKGKVRGVIALINKANGSWFSQKDEDILSAVCSHISVAMSDDKHNFDEIIETCEQSMTTSGAAEWSRSARRIANNLYLPALEGIRTVLGAEAVTLMLVDQTNQELYTEVIDGPLPPHRSKFGEGIIGEAVETGEILNIAVSDTDRLDLIRHRDYQGSGINVTSELAVPLLNTSKKCIGAIKCINKIGAATFTEEDVKYATIVADYVAMVLEGPNAGIRRVLALSRQRMQEKRIIESTNVHHCAVIAGLDRVENLPNSKIDSYVTFSITRGDPMVGQRPGLQQRLLKSRNKDRTSTVRKFAKSDTILHDANPKFDNTIAVALPQRFEGVPVEELFLFIVLWDYSPCDIDDVVAHLSIPLSALPNEPQTESRPYKLLPVVGQEAVYDLEKAQIWLSLSTNKIAAARENK